MTCRAARAIKMPIPERRMGCCPKCGAGGELTGDADIKDTGRYQEKYVCAYCTEPDGHYGNRPFVWWEVFQWQPRLSGGDYVELNGEVSDDPADV